MAKPQLWKPAPEAHDYPAADEYLALIMNPAERAKVMRGFQTAALTHRKAKDILRASGLPVLPATEKYVAKNLQKVKNGTPLSPVLLVRGNVLDRIPLTIADGYHRVCASYLIDADAEIPCLIAEI